MIKPGLKNTIETPDCGEAALTGYDYHVYTMTLRDRLLAFVIGAAGAAIVMHIFFGNVFVDLLAMVVTGIVAQKIYRKMMIERIKNKLTIQFKDMLDSVTSSISAGKVAQAAFMDAEKDMRLQYGEDSYIFRELHKINIGLCNNLTIETILSDFGRRSGVEDIESFANVFVIANRQGGNIKTILTETKSILCDKIEIGNKDHARSDKESAQHHDDNAAPHRSDERRLHRRRGKLLLEHHGEGRRAYRIRHCLHHRKKDYINKNVTEDIADECDITYSWRCCVGVLLRCLFQER